MIVFSVRVCSERPLQRTKAMLMRFSSNNSRPAVMVSVAIALLLLHASSVGAQDASKSNFNTERILATDLTKRTADNPPVDKKPATIEEKLAALEQLVEQQSQRLNQLQQTVTEQQDTIHLLVSRSNVGAASNETAALTTDNQPAQSPAVEDRLKKVEGRLAELGAIKFSGDIRLRSESFFGLTNNLASGSNPAVLG